MPHHAMPRRPRHSLRTLLVAVLLASFVSVILAGQARHAAAIDNPEYILSASSEQSISVQVGATFPASLVRVTKFTNFSTPVPGVTVNWTVFPASNGAKASFEGGATTASSVSDSAGFAASPTFTANSIAGSYTLQAKAVEPFHPDAAIPNAFSLTNLDGASTKVLLLSAGDGSLQAAKVNTTYTSPFSAIALDGNNQLKSGVTVVFTAPSSGPSGTFSDTGTNTTTAVTNSTGVATSASYTANGSPGSYSVVASVDGSQTVDGQPRTNAFGVANSFTDVLGVPYTISIASGGGAVSTNTAVTPNMSVAVFDGSLAYVPDATVTFSAPTSGPSGTFPGGSTTYTTTTGPTGLAGAPTFTSNGISGGFSVTVMATKNNVSATAGIAFVNGRVRTTTTLTTAPNGSSVYGQEIVLTATVRPVEGNAVPGGPVTFKAGGNPIGACTDVTPSGGVATCTLNSGTNESTWLTPATYSFSADYAGDPESTQPSASAAVPHTVNKAATAVQITSSAPAYVLVNQPVTFTATVSAVAPGRGTPTGGVTVASSDGTAINGGQPLALANGSAQVSVTFTQTGDPVITATYGESSNFNGSSNTFTQHVYSVPEVTTDPSSQLVIVGNAATFTAAATGYPAPTVQWQVSADNGATFADIPNATAATYSFNPVGADNRKQYRAVFTNRAGADTSAAATLTVKASTTLAVPAATGTYGGTVSLSAILRDTGGTPLAGKAVAFTLNGASVGAATTDASGVATLASAGLGGIDAGSYATGVGVSFGGDSAYEASEGSGSLTVAPAAGSVSIANLPASGVVGNSVVLTYTKLGDGTPSATSQTGNICTVSGGLLTFVAEGTCQLQAVTTAGTNHLAATGPVQSVTVGPAAKKSTTTTLTASPNPAAVGQAITFTAQVSPTAAAGTVAFMDGAALLGSATLSGGRATITVGTLAAGTHQITAVYGGSANHVGSTSAALAQVVGAPAPTFTLTVAKAGTGTGTVTSAPAGIDCGATCAAAFASGTAVTLTAQPAPGSTFAGWGGDCTGATCTVGMAAARSVTATFTLDPAAKAATTTTRASSLSPASFGQAVTFTAQVSPAGATGTITFMDGAATLGTATLVNGQATLTTAALSPVQHSITAVYSGDATYAGSTSSQLSQVVVKAKTTVTLASSANPSVVGQAVTFTAQVSPGTATGTITFKDGNKVLGTVALVNGQATFTTAALGGGRHSITAVYSGDATNAGSTSAVLTQVVNRK